MANRWNKLVSKTIAIIVLMSFVSCRTGRFASYAADIGDSMLIYIPNLPCKTKTTDVYAIYVYYNYFDFYYLLSVDEDSIRYSDQFDYFGKFPIKRTKKEILITKRDANSELFRKPELDSIKLRKVSNSYIDRRHERKYIVKSHFYENVISRNENLNKKKEKLK